MEAGSYVWCTADSKSEEAWILAEVVKRTDQELELKQVDKAENAFKRPLDTQDQESGALKFQGVELANAPLSDEDRAEGRDNDLITLPHLHEPAILHAVSERFFHGKIYTWTGPVLIAVNPFQRLPLYTDVSNEGYLDLGQMEEEASVQSISLDSRLTTFVFVLRNRKSSIRTEVKVSSNHKVWATQSRT